MREIIRGVSAGVAGNLNRGSGGRVENIQILRHVFRICRRDQLMVYWIKSEEKYPIKLDIIRGMGLNGSN
jgi:hypothetical protein